MSLSLLRSHTREAGPEVEVMVGLVSPIEKDNAAGATAGENQPAAVRGKIVGDG